MLTAAVDIGSNTTRVLVAEPQNGQLRAVMEQRAYTRIGRGAKSNGAIRRRRSPRSPRSSRPRSALPGRLGPKHAAWSQRRRYARPSTAPRSPPRSRLNRGWRVDVISEREEGRLAFLGATKTLGHPAEGKIAVVDVGGASSEIVIGTIAKGAKKVKSFAVGSGSLAESYLKGDPPSAAEIRKVRDRIDEVSRRSTWAVSSRPSPSVAARPRCAAWSAPCSNTRPWSGASASSRLPPKRWPAIRARHPSRRGSAKRNPDPREDLRDPRPAASDRQRWPARGHHPRSAQQRQQ